MKNSRIWFIVLFTFILSSTYGVKRKRANSHQLNITVHQQSNHLPLQDSPTTPEEQSKPILSFQYLNQSFQGICNFFSFESSDTKDDLNSSDTQLFAKEDIGDLISDEEILKEAQELFLVAINEKVGIRAMLGDALLNNIVLECISEKHAPISRYTLHHMKVKYVSNAYLYERGQEIFTNNETKAYLEKCGVHELGDMVETVIRLLYENFNYSTTVRFVQILCNEEI